MEIISTSGILPFGFGLLAVAFAGQHGVSNGL